MTILVTGATGFVPANVITRLVAEGREVIAFDVSPLDPTLAARVRAVGPGQVTFVQGDTRDAAVVNSLFTQHRPQGVIHMAAMTPLNVDIERRAIRRVVETNVNGTLNVLLASAEHGVRRVVFLSSSSVYAPAVGPALIDEGAPVREDGGLYSLTKLAGEQLCRWTATALGLDCRMVRLGPVYGPWERPTNSRQRMSSVCQAVEEALAGRTLRCNNAELERDWIHAADVARGLIVLLDLPEPGHDTYNLAGPAVSMERTLAAVAAAIPGTTVEWVAHSEDANVPIPEGATRASLDSSRMRAASGWSPGYDIESGVRAYVEWLRG
jgi:UDP-glucose 4-epimerase/UDP-glucuronate 4-epimerase